MINALTICKIKNGHVKTLKKKRMNIQANRLRLSMIRERASVKR